MTEMMKRYEDETGEYPNSFNKGNEYTKKKSSVIYSIEIKNRFFLQEMR